MVKRLLRKRVKSVGLPPGTLIHVGEKKVEEVSIQIIDYNEDHVIDKHVTDLSELPVFLKNNHVTWININGLHNTDIIGKIGKTYNMHPLVMEDIVNTEHRSKFEDYEDYLFMIVKMLTYDDDKDEVVTEQVSFLLSSDSLITFQEREGDVFQSIRERIMSSKGRIRKMGADFLMYALVDAIIEQYYLILEKIELRLEKIEEELIKSPTNKTLQAIHNLRRDVLYLKSTVWPLREIANNIIRDEIPFIKESTHIYLRDVYDHSIQIFDVLETIRDMISSMLDTYLSSVSNRMNEVMKVLTIISTIFIPLSFIAGVYGMNFKFMPELDWIWGYPIVWLIMIAVTITMIVYFKRKKWM